MDKHFLEGPDIFCTVFLVHVPTNICYLFDFIGIPKFAEGEIFAWTNYCPKLYIRPSSKQML